MTGSTDTGVYRVYRLWFDRLPSMFGREAGSYFRGLALLHTAELELADPGIEKSAELDIPDAPAMMRFDIAPVSARQRALGSSARLLEMARGVVEKPS